MLNKAPIFVNGFQRGGTNILVNLIVSHPDVCKVGETHTVFYGPNRGPAWEKWRQRALYFPVFLTARQHLFWIERYNERNRLPRPMMHYVDLLFYWRKLSSPENKIKNNGSINSRKEIARSRLLGKNVNGLTLATPVLADIYPDATFISLVRNGLAVCEGFTRRGATAEKVGRMYQRVCQQMIEYANAMDNFHIVRFEDILDDPTNTVRKIYQLANLPLEASLKFRLQAKRSMSADGRCRYTFGGKQDREIHWFPLEELRTHLRKDVNENQIARLSQEDKQAFLQHTQEQMAYFGYV